MKKQTKHKIYIGYDSRDIAKVVKEKVQLIVTSPPYWNIKDYGHKDQIGYHESYKQYIKSLDRVWKGCYEILDDGCRLCVNIGDQFTRTKDFGRYKVIPIRTDIIKYCEEIRFDYMGALNC